MKVHCTDYSLSFEEKHHIFKQKSFFLSNLFLVSYDMRTVLVLALSQWTSSNDNSNPKLNPPTESQCTSSSWKKRKKSSPNWQHSQFPIKIINFMSKQLKNLYSACLKSFRWSMLSDKAFAEIEVRCRIQYWVSSCIYLCFSQLFPIAWIAANFIVIQQTNLMFVYKKFNQDFQYNVNLEKDEWTYRKEQEKID